MRKRQSDFYEKRLKFTVRLKILAIIVVIDTSSQRSCSTFNPIREWEGPD